MYLDYWQLDRKPFDMHGVGEPPFLPEGQRSALRKLRYSVENRAAAALIAGPAGVGKTLLIDALQQELGDKFRPFASVVFPQMSARDLLAYLADRLGAPPVESADGSIQQSLRRLETVLADNVDAGRHAVVVIDEAHALEDGALLEPLRLLMNLRAANQPALTLVLSGQPDLLPIVERFGAFDQRIELKVVLPALDAAETAEYVNARLQAAGATREIFSADAIEAIHKLTGGVARRINRLCDLSLLVGFANSQASIDEDQLYAVHEELIQLGRRAA